MAKASSDWLTALHCSFQDHENLYLVNTPVLKERFHIVS